MLCTSMNQDLVPSGILSSVMPILASSTACNSGTSFTAASTLSCSLKRRASSLRPTPLDVDFCATLNQNYKNHVEMIQRDPKCRLQFDQDRPSVNGCNTEGARSSSHRIQKQALTSCPSKKNLSWRSAYSEKLGTQMRNEYELLKNMRTRKIVGVIHWYTPDK